MKGLAEHVIAARRISSPVGELTLAASAKGLTTVAFDGQIEGTELPSDDPDNPHLNAAESWLRDYFANKPRAIDITFDLRGTAFQESVWNYLTTIHFGETRTYGDIAEHIGNPRSVRAVGLATGKNPISIINPCHRIMGADGSLTGFAGGLDNKRKLLAHEGLWLGGL